MPPLPRSVSRTPSKLHRRRTLSNTQALNSTQALNIGSNNESPLNTKWRPLNKMLACGNRSSDNGARLLKYLLQIETAGIKPQ